MYIHRKVYKITAAEHINPINRVQHTNIVQNFWITWTGGAVWRVAGDMNVYG